MPDLTCHMRQIRMLFKFACAIWRSDEPDIGGPGFLCPGIMRGWLMDVIVMTGRPSLRRRGRSYPGLGR